MRINTPCREVAQLGRAPGSGPGGRGFKSRLPDRAYGYVFNKQI